MPLPGARIWLRLIGYSLAVLLVGLLQLLVVPWISVAGIVPDILLLVTLWIALREGQIAGTAAGFAIGLFQDVLLQGELGTAALAKTVAGFLAGFFARPADPEWLRSASPLRLLGISAVGCAVHNGLYFLVVSHPLEVAPAEFVLKYAIAATGYTLVFAAVFILGWRFFRGGGSTSVR